MAGTKLTILECGHTTLDYELVVTGDPDTSFSEHLAADSAAAPRRKIRHPVYAYVIEHDDARILVDTGMSVTFKRDWKNNFYKEALAYDPGEDGLFTQRLEQRGIDPQSFTDVIITHLHTDHAGNLPMFAASGARIIVHEDELRGAVTVKGGLLRDDLVTLWGVTSPQGFTRKDFGCLLPNRATTVFADQEIYRGVWTVSLPGHTWGTMGVAVKLPHSGWILIASDHIYLSASYRDPFVGNILNQDPGTWAKSAVKVRRLAGKYAMRVLPGHDNKIIVPEKGPAFRIEDLKPFYD
ncbi:MAG: N-acyl homoserine lactonase family protein [Candidatus Binataceae bacterium]